MCGKAKEAGKCPSYTGLVLTFVHNYNIDNINKPAPGCSYSIFHCALLSISLELVSSLSPNLLQSVVFSPAGDKIHPYTTDITD